MDEIPTDEAPEQQPITIINDSVAMVPHTTVSELHPSNMIISEQPNVEAQWHHDGDDTINTNAVNPVIAETNNNDNTETTIHDKSYISAAETTTADHVIITEQEDIQPQAAENTNEDVPPIEEVADEVALPPVDAQDVVAEDDHDILSHTILVDEKDVADSQHNSDRPYSLRRNRSNWRNYDDKMNSVFATIGYALANISVKRGIRDLGIDAIVSIMKELQQLDDKGVFDPMIHNKLDNNQKRKALRTIMFLKLKRDGRLKSRLCADGRGQPRQYGVTEVKVSSPTVATESVFTTAAIEAFEERHVVTADIEGAYLHANIEGADDDDEVIIVLDPIMTTILVAICPHYEQFISRCNRLFIKLRKALYGLIQSARLFYEHISATLTNFGFKINPYDICVFNKTIHGKQCTVIIHVDDLKISCGDRRGVDAVINELQRIYKKVNICEGPIVDYLGMEFNYTNRGFVIISMKAMVEETMDELSVKGTTTTPATIQLFKRLAIYHQTIVSYRRNSENNSIQLCRNFYTCQREPDPIY